MFQDFLLLHPQVVKRDGMSLLMDIKREMETMLQEKVEATRVS